MFDDVSSFSMQSFSPKVPNFPSKNYFFNLIIFFFESMKFFFHFWYIFGTGTDLFRKWSMLLQMWAQFLKKKNWNLIPYKILGKLLKFHANWIINKVNKRKPTDGLRVIKLAYPNILPTLKIKEL